jgi:hypothetical protein
VRAVDLGMHFCAALVAPLSEQAYKPTEATACRLLRLCCGGAESMQRCWTDCNCLGALCCAVLSADPGIGSSSTCQEELATCRPLSGWHRTQQLACVLPSTLWRPQGPLLTSSQQQLLRLTQRHLQAPQRLAGSVLWLWEPQWWEDLLWWSRHR